jgi:hypothetical protein
LRSAAAAEAAFSQPGCCVNGDKINSHFVNGCSVNDYQMSTTANVTITNVNDYQRQRLAYRTRGSRHIG